MEKYTRSMPGCYHSMIQYLAETTGIPARKEIAFNNLRDLYYKTKSKKPSRMWKLAFHSYNIKVETDQGTICFMQAGPQRFDHAFPGIQAKRFLVDVWRPQTEFGIPIRNAGSYKDCLGGGWTCTGPMVEVQGKFFAPQMECSCGH